MCIYIYIYIHTYIYSLTDKMRWICPEMDCMSRLKIFFGTDISLELRICDFHTNTHLVGLNSQYFRGLADLDGCQNQLGQIPEEKSNTSSLTDLHRFAVCPCHARPIPYRRTLIGGHHARLEIHQLSMSQRIGYHQIQLAFPVGRVFDQSHQCFTTIQARSVAGGLLNQEIIVGLTMLIHMHIIHR